MLMPRGAFKVRRARPPRALMSVEARALRLNEKAADINAVAPSIETRRLAPGDGEILVEIKAAAINPSDAKAAFGMMPHAVWPRTAGRDWCGVVRAGRFGLPGQGRERGRLAADGLPGQVEPLASEQRQENAARIAGVPGEFGEVGVFLVRLRRRQVDGHGRRRRCGRFQHHVDAGGIEGTLDEHYGVAVAAKGRAAASRSETPSGVRASHRASTAASSAHVP